MFDTSIIRLRIALFFFQYNLTKIGLLFLTRKEAQETAIELIKILSQNK